MEQLEPYISEKIDRWLQGDYDQESKNEIQQLLKNKSYTELTDAFYQDLEFGTGGLRGVLGVGSNRMNKYTVGAATQGFANYLNQLYNGEEISVVIAHDSRNFSDQFAHIIANIFSGNGIKVFLFEEMRPTPELSYAIRELGAKGGVMVTASHNPREYNGYKAYGEDGGQLIAPHDKNVINEVAKIKDVSEINFSGNKDLIVKIGEEMDKKYLSTLEKLSVNKIINQRQKDLKIVYTPLHGTGITVIPDALKSYGFENLTVIEEQAVPDGNFPTVVYPNPEEAEALTLALKKAKEIDADLVLATDPDADRVGIAAKNSKGEWELMNGNQTLSLIVYYMLNAWEQKGLIKGNEYIINTIVTSDLIDKMAEAKGVECYNVLTGFKHIGAVMTRLMGQKKFIAGGEESYGYLVGDHVRDKDAIVSSAIIAEIAAFYKDQGKSLFDALTEMYLQYGFYKERLVSFTKKGKSGAEEIKAMMEQYRKEPPQMINGQKVVLVKDYQLSIEKHIEKGTTATIDLPKSNVLQFITADGSKISARPSGTEPKIKFYISVNAALNSKEDYWKVNEQLENKIDAIVKDLNI